MKKSKYDKTFDPMKEVLIEYATMKDDRGCLMHTGPEVCRKFGLGTDITIVDAFNRWLNRNGVRRRKYTQRSAIEVPEELFPATKEETIPQPRELSTEEYETILGSFIEMMVSLREHIGAMQEAINKGVGVIRNVFADDRS